MQIVRVETVPIALPFREPYRTARGVLAERSIVVFRIHLDDGTVGLGEAVPLSLRGGPSLEQVSVELASCGAALVGTDASPALRGDPAEIRAWIWRLLGEARARRTGRQALAAVDVALHDLAGRISGLPVWRLLGAGEARPVACNATIDAGDPDQVAATAADQLAAGFSTFKVKVGTEGDLERVAAVRDAIGETPLLRIDANAAWDVETAVSKLTAMRIYNLELAEQPCLDLTELAALRARTPVPIVADESAASLEDARLAVRKRACDAATIKLAKVGGPLEALRIAAVIPSLLSSALDGPIGIAAAIHLAQAMPAGGSGARFAHGLATLELFAAHYAHPRALCGPRVLPPRSAGLGVDIDESALRALQVT